MMTTMFAARLLLLAATASALSACATIGTSPNAPVATGHFVDATGAHRGTLAVMQQGDGSLRFAITATGLTPGVHGAHIHTTGQCEGPAFASAGGHWNPDNHQHGTANPMGPHKGDLPNITVDGSGNGAATFTVPGPLSAMLDTDGAAFIIHAAADDNMTDPSGNSGARQLCAVITAGG